jgi:hypothetical protein
MCIMSISLLNLSAPQVFHKALHNSLSCQNWSIWFFKPDCLVLYTGYVQPPHQIPEALVGPQSEHVRPSSLSQVNQAYPAPYPGSRDLIHTCPSPSPDMSGLSTLFGSLSEFQRPNLDLASQPYPRLPQPYPAS